MTRVNGPLKGAEFERQICKRSLVRDVKLGNSWSWL